MHEIVRRALNLQLALLLLVALTSVVAITAYDAAADAAVETEAQLVAIEELRSEVLSAETGLRGYVLVREESFLEPFQAALPRVDAMVSRLVQELGDDDVATVREVKAVFDAWRDDFAAVVLDQLESGDDDQALGLIESGAGKRRIDRIRTLTADLSTDIGEQARRRDDAADLRGRIALGAIVVGALAALLAGDRLRRRLQHRVVGPIAALASTADDFGRGDLDARADVGGTAEIATLATAFNTMAAQLSATVNDLRAVDRLKSEFVSVVSHELRTPLTSIRGSLGLLASGALGEFPDDAREMLTIAVSNTDRLVRLINDILDLERMESGQESLDLAPAAIATLMSDAASSVAGSADAAGVRIEVIPIDGDVVVDADRVVRALTNLLGNAIKFSGRGTWVVLAARRLDDAVAFEVRDSGRGIPPDQLARVFERFAQVDASDARDRGGTGLGLAIVEGIARQHGGRVEVSSEVGVGSTFTVVLPWRRRARDRAALPTPVGMAPSGDADRGPVVVLAEDDESLRQVVSVRLQQHGVRVVPAASIGEVVDRVLSEHPAVLVLDVRLADGDAFEVVRALRADDWARSLTTVVFTVLDLDPAERERLRLGPTTFVTKGEAADDRLDEAVLAALGRRTETAGG